MATSGITGLQGVPVLLAAQEHAEQQAIIPLIAVTLAVHLVSCPNAISNNISKHQHFFEVSGTHLLYG